MRKPLARRRLCVPLEPDIAPSFTSRRSFRAIEKRSLTPSVGRNLFLLMAANIPPLVAARVLGPRWARPVDGGSKAPDGRRLLGDAKTWRGCAVSLIGTMAVGCCMNVAPAVAMRFGLLSMGGDIVASFLKRRIGIAVHGRSPVLDQLPEAILPFVFLRRQLATRRRDVIEAIFVFTVLEEPLSRVLFRLGLRDRPF